MEGKAKRGKRKEVKGQRRQECDLLENNYTMAQSTTQAQYKQLADNNSTHAIVSLAHSIRSQRRAKCVSLYLSLSLSVCGSLSLTLEFWMDKKGRGKTDKKTRTEGGQ